MATKFEKEVPTFWELSPELKKTLIKEFSHYVFKNIRFQHFIMLVSISALAFQSQRLLATYLEFQTVVKVDIQKPFEINITGVTICTDEYHMVVKSKLEARYPELKQKIDELIAGNVTDEESHLEVYRRYKQIAYNESTIDEWFKLLVEPSMIFDCKIIGRTMYMNAHNQSTPTCEEFSPPVWSLPYGAGVCWSYFSEINRQQIRHTRGKYYHYYTIEVQKGVQSSFKFRFDRFKDIVRDPIPPSDDDDEEYSNQVYAVVNHPKEFKSIISLDRASIKVGTNFDIQVSQTNAKMLPDPYVTDCRQYELEDRWKNFMSNYQCLDECVAELLYDRCDCMFNQSRGDRITRWTPNYTDPKVPKHFCVEVAEENTTDVCKSNSLFNRKVALRSHCSLKGICKNDCYEEYFRSEIKQTFWDKDIDGYNETVLDDDYFYYGWTEPLYAKAMPNESWATLNIKRKDVADITYIHTREMIFVEFVCYFGGLLGLWLGVSILDMYHQLLVWWAEAPGEYEKWLDRQRVRKTVPKISLNRTGNISLISDNLKTYMDIESKLSENNTNNNNKTTKVEFHTQYDQQYANYQYN